MPSDDRASAALHSVSAQSDAFRAAVAEAVDQVSSQLAVQRASTNGQAARAGHELGSFAAGRIDNDRFGELFGQKTHLESDALRVMERALDVLVSTLMVGERLFRVTLEPDSDLRATVAASLALAGRAFAAAHLVELARGGRHGAVDVEDMLGGYPAARWNRAERQLAPPLVIELEGSDLRAGGLEEFLQGGQKIVLVARGESPPAPLARLISPGVYVMQCLDVAALAEFAAAPGPGIAAALPESAARFVHDPGRAQSGPRLTIGHIPALGFRRRLGRITGFQQSEDLRLLVDLASVAGVPALATANGSHEAEEGSAAPADKLAAWLLRQADLTNLG